MANICEQNVAISASKKDLKTLMLQMAANLKGVNDEIPLDLDALAKKRKLENIADALNCLAREGGWSLLGLFSSSPDIVSEFSSVSVSSNGDSCTLFVNLGLKWSESELPAAFCSGLDHGAFGWSISSFIEGADDLVTVKGEGWEGLYFPEDDPVNFESIRVLVDKKAAAQQRADSSEASFDDQALLALLSRGVPGEMVEDYERTHKEPELCKV
jgi:hypothetical protein